MKMVKIFEVEGYEAVKAKLNELKGYGHDVFVLFSGSKDQNKLSWCSDCVAGQ